MDESGRERPRGTFSSLLDNVVTPHLSHCSEETILETAKMLWRGRFTEEEVAAIGMLHRDYPSTSPQEIVKSLGIRYRSSQNCDNLRVALGFLTSTPELEGVDMQTLSLALAATPVTLHNELIAMFCEYGTTCFPKSSNSVMDLILAVINYFPSPRTAYELYAQDPDLFKLVAKRKIKYTEVAANRDHDRDHEEEED